MPDGVGYNSSGNNLPRSMWCIHLSHTAPQFFSHATHGKTCVCGHMHNLDKNKLVDIVSTTFAYLSICIPYFSRYKLCLSRAEEPQLIEAGEHIIQSAGTCRMQKNLDQNHPKDIAAGATFSNSTLMKTQSDANRHGAAKKGRGTRGHPAEDSAGLTGGSYHLPLKSSRS